MQQAKPAQIVYKPTGGQITAPVMPRSVRDFFRATGRIGGSAKSPAKAKAARENGKLGGKLGGRPRKQQKALLKSTVLASAQVTGEGPLHPQD